MEPEIEAQVVMPQENFRETIGHAPVVRHLGNYLSFGEIKRLRHVCSSWNDGLKSHPRFNYGKIKFTPSNIRQIQIAEMPRCTAAQLEVALGRRTHFIQRIWIPRYEATLRVLTIRKVSVPCITLCEFITALPVLEEITLKELNFQPIFDGNNIIYCRHVDQQNEAEPVHARTIRKVKFSDIPVVPTCLLILLRNRCRSVLEEFDYSDVQMTPGRAVSIPSWITQITQMRLLLTENVATLGKLVWSNNDCYIEPLMILNDQGFQPIMLREIEILPLNQSPANYLQIYSALSQQPRYIHPETGLTKLHLGLNGEYTLAQIEAIIQPMNQLQDLALHFHQYVQNMNVPTFRIDFQHLTRFHSLEISQTAGASHVIELDTVGQDLLPQTLRALVLNTQQSVNMEKLNGLLAGGRHAHLTKLAIGQLDETDIEDGAIQLIIQELPLLEDLSVTDAARVTDSGFTGLPLKTVKTIIQARSYKLLFGQETHVQPAGTRNLSELKYLRRLNLSGCCQVGDITIALTQFQYLRDINLSYLNNVTDFGIMYLTKRNPGLEKVSFMHNNKVSNFGLNQLFRNSPSLISLKTSRSVQQRLSAGLQYTRYF